MSPNPQDNSFKGDSWVGDKNPYPHDAHQGYRRPINLRSALAFIPGENHETQQLSNAVCYEDGSQIVLPREPQPSLYRPMFQPPNPPQSFVQPIYFQSIPSHTPYSQQSLRQPSVYHTPYPTNAGQPNHELRRYNAARAAPQTTTDRAHRGSISFDIDPARSDRLATAGPGRIHQGSDLSSFSHDSTPAATTTLSRRGPLSADYQKRKYPARFFVVGRVFQSVLSEQSERKSDVVSMAWSKDGYGQWVYSTTRRFVVVREGNKNCSVLPITTYNGQGVLKAGVRVEEHGVIHTGKEAPIPQDVLPSGPQMQPVAIRVDADKQTMRLDEWSRIDYARTTTVDHKARVRSIGKVNSAFIVDLLMQYRNVSFSRNDPGSPQDSLLGEFASLQLSPSPPANTSYYSQATSAIDILMKSGWTREAAVEIIRAPTLAETTDDHEALEVEKDENLPQDTVVSSDVTSSGEE